jgi:hypothetical protein
MDGLYLPEDDRRHYVAWSNLTKDDFGADEDARKTDEGKVVDSKGRMVEYIEKPPPPLDPDIPF